MKARAERLKNRGEQLRTHGLSVNATLQLFAGAIADQEHSRGPEPEEKEEDNQTREPVNTAA